MSITAAERETVVIPGRAPSARALKRLGASLLAIGLVAGAAWHADEWRRVGRFLESTDDAYIGGDITVMAPRVAGLIAEVPVGDNQAVHAGDLLVKLDDRDYLAALAKADGAVVAATARIANLDATRRLQEAIIAVAAAEVAASDAEAARARFDVDRYRQLASDQFASTQRLQQADADHKKGIAAAEKARASLDAASRRLDIIATEKQEADAALTEAVAERDLAKLNLAYTELRAPVDGVVGNRTARVGAYATVGAQLLAVVPAKGLWIDANFKESQLARMRPGLLATVTADVLPGEVFHGHVASLAPATGAQFSVLPPENATGNFTKIVQRVPVRILVDGDAATLGRLRPGLSVVATVDERPPEGGVP
jgi:membrane fusion protein (multidrug efflux system)